MGADNHEAKRLLIKLNESAKIAESRHQHWVIIFRTWSSICNRQMVWDITSCQQTLIIIPLTFSCQQEFWCQQEFLFSWFYTCSSPGAGADNALGTKFWCQQEHLVTSVICCKFKKISLKSDFIQFFHDFIHVYSPRTGADSPQGTKFWCQQKCLVTSPISCKFKKMSLKSTAILCIFFHDLIHVYSPGAGVDSPQGTKFWCQQKCLVTSFICCKFKKMSLKSDFIYFFMI